MRTRDRVVRAGLVAIDAGLGRWRPDVRATCRYGIDLIDSGATAEFYALVRHRLRRAWAARRAGASVSDGPPIRIDARRERLTHDGRVTAKTTPAQTWPDGGSRVLVSVIIPCFNYGRYLDEAIASVRAQTLASLEIIVVDDGSTEADTRAVLARLDREPDVRVIRQSNQGLPAARNHGIDAARGEYVCCLDADDWLGPTYLEQAVAVLSSDRAVGFAGSWVQFFGDRDDLWRTEDFDPERALTGNFTSVASVFRRDDWQEVGGFSRDMVGGFEDWEFWIRLAMLGRRGRTIAHPLFRHRRHGRTMTDTAKAMQLELRQRMRRLCPSFYEEASARERLGRLRSVDPADAGLAALASVPGLTRADPRPGLLVVVTGLLQGGAHALLHDIVRGLVGAWRVVIVTTGAGPHALDGPFRTTTAEVFHLDGFLPGEAWGGFLTYVIRTRRVDVLLSSDCLWLLDTLPGIRTAHPGLRVLDLVHNHVPTSTFRAAVARTAAIDRHVVVSRPITRALTAAGIAADKVVEIANGVDVSVFAPTRMERGEARRQLALPASPVVLLAWAGRMSEEKRPALFVDLVEALAREAPVYGVMFGDGPEAPGVDAAIRARGLVHCLERRPFAPRDRLADLYCAVDLVVLTSRVEGMPLVLLEALASGCPVLATDAGDAARVVEHEVNGFLVPVNDAEALLAHAQTFVGDGARQARMRLAAVESLRRGPYQLSRMTEAYARLLQDVAGRPGAISGSPSGC